MDRLRGVSADGKTMEFISSRTHADEVWVRDLASGRERQVTHGGTDDATLSPEWNLQQAHFSPDGQWVAFQTTTSPNVRQTYVARVVPGTSTVPQDWVPVVLDHGCHPSWSADGSLLYHFSFRDGAFCPWVQRVDPVTKRPIGPPRAVLHLHNPRLRAASGAAATNAVRGGYL